MNQPTTSLKVVVAQPAEFASTAADLVASTVTSKPDAVIGLPTGNTPMPVYKELVARARAGKFDASRLRINVLDDFLGVPADSTVSFFAWLRRAILDPLGIGDDRILRIPTDEHEIERRCTEYEAKLRKWGGCELQLLGLGGNGHIGFNEPGSPRDSRTRSVKLTQQSKAASAAYWNGASVPNFGVTMGIATILEARHIGLLVNGKSKARILERTLHGPIGPQVPASFLREAENVTVIADAAAAVMLKD